MKTKLLALLLTLAMLTPALAACGNTVPNETESDTAGNPAVETPDISAEADTSHTVDLVTDGVSEYVIVRAENASDYEITASTELQAYLKQITGAELPIVTDATAAVAKEIVIGLTNRETEGQFDRAELINDGFIIKTESGKLWIIGGNEYGTLYGVYELLESYLGCRFYTAEFEKVPATDTISLSIEEDKQVPFIASRHNYIPSLLNNSTLRFKQKTRTPNWAGGMCHTLAGLAEAGDGNSTDPCLHNEEIYQTVLKNVRALLEAKPDAEYISVSQNDGGGCCSCDACNTCIEEHGRSGHYLQFVNRIAEEIADEYPNVLVHTFAYANTLEPPKTEMRAASNIIVQVPTIDACISHPLYECNVRGDYCGTEAILETSKHLESWRELCDHMAIWDYTSCLGNFNFPFANFDTLWQNMRYYVENKVQYVFSQGTHSGETYAEFQELRAYLISKLLWDPTMGEEKYYALMDEFLEDYYGPGWESIRAFIDYTGEISASTHLSWELNYSDYLLFPNPADKKSLDLPIPELSADTLRNYKDVDWSQYYTYFAPQFNDVAEKGIEFFNAAMEAAETDEQRFRIGKSSTQADMLYAYHIKLLYERYAYNALTKIFEGNLKTCVEDGSMTKEESIALKAAFNAEIKEPLKDSVHQYTITVAEKMQQYGIPYLHSGTTIQEFLDGERKFWY